MKHAISASILLVIMAGPALAQTKQQSIDAYCQNTARAAAGTSSYMACALMMNQIIQPVEPQCAAIGIGVNDPRFERCAKTAAAMALTGMQLPPGFYPTGPNTVTCEHVGTRLNCQ